MKICIINSSYDGANSDFEQYNELPDPTPYISPSRHQFHARYVTKIDFKKDIDKICEEEFDMFMNYMFCQGGQEGENIVDVEAIRYLESKNVTVLTNPSSFLSLTKINLATVAATIETFRVPPKTSGKYPKIVKYADLCGSFGLDMNSICIDEAAVDNRVTYMKEKMPSLGVMVQDYIIGKECSAMDTPHNEEFLTWEHKFVSVDKGIIKYAFVEGQDKLNLQTSAVNVFKALGAVGGGGWARVDMRIEHGTGDVYVIEVNLIPAVFYPINNTLGDEMVITETFPGEQPAFFDMLVATKWMQLGRDKGKQADIANTYDAVPDYPSLFDSTAYATFERKLVADFGHSGTILDLACEPGVFGKIVREFGTIAEITACDISAHMLEHPNLKEYYKQPADNCPLEECVMGAAEHDHFVCFGALLFLNTETFNAVLARMFMLARKSVSFNIEAVSEQYIKDSQADYADSFVIANHTQALEDFDVPRGWRIAYRSERQWLYKSPSGKTDIYGQVIRFERV